MERVLVAVLADTRSHGVAWPSFKRHVLDELDADLALAITIDDETYDYANPYWQHAEHRWTGVQPADIAVTWDLVQQRLCDQRGIAPPDWRLMLGIDGNWRGGIRAPDSPLGYAANLIYCRWLLLHGLEQGRLLDRYDRFVVTRSDFVWLCPHPPLSILHRSSLWVPDVDDWGGINDRHLVVSRDDVGATLNLIEDILLRPTELYEEMKRRSDWNIESFLGLHLARKWLMPRVKVFPNVMYTARGVRDTPSSASPGRFDPSVGHVVKYESEFSRARAYATVIKTREDWENGEWRALDHARAAAEYHPSVLQRYVSWPARDVVWGLRRPGRLARIGRFLRRGAARARS